MKICLFGISGIAPGKHNLKDPRLDQADKLVEAQKKTYAQVDVVEEKELLTCDAILTSHAALSDLVDEGPRFRRDAAEPRRGRGGEGGAAKARRRAGQREARFRRGPHGRGTRGHFGAQFLFEQAGGRGHGGRTGRPGRVAGAGFCGERLHQFSDRGRKENRAWPIRAGLTAWEAAGTIHTDIQHGFIRAEIISFADFVEAGGETQAKRAGKQRLELKTYVMQDYDVTNFRFNK